MYRVSLTDQQRIELNRRSHQPGLAPGVRDRLEMLRLSDAGWRIPKIAQHLGQHEQTVRSWIKAFLAGGFDALQNKPRGGSASALTSAVLEAVRQELNKADRTWSAGQIADWIARQFHVSRSADAVRRKLRKERLSYKRTSRSLRHKQNPKEVADKSAALTTLQKGALPDA